MQVTLANMNGIIVGLQLNFNVHKVMQQLVLQFTSKYNSEINFMKMGIYQQCR